MAPAWWRFRGCWTCTFTFVTRARQRKRISTLELPERLQAERQLSWTCPTMTRPSAPAKRLKPRWRRQKARQFATTGSCSGQLRKTRPKRPASEKRRVPSRRSRYTSAQVPETSLLPGFPKLRSTCASSPQASRCASTPRMSVSPVMIPNPPNGLVLMVPPPNV